jgi:hypothetical protein
MRVIGHPLVAIRRLLLILVIRSEVHNDAAACGQNDFGRTHSGAAHGPYDAGNVALPE